MGTENVGLSSSKSWKFRIVGKNLPPKGQITLSDFYKMRHGEGVPGPYLHAKVHVCAFNNVALKALKSSKFIIFSINLLNDFTKFGMGRESHTFNRCYFQNVGLQPPKSPKSVLFWYKFAVKGYIPLSHFYQRRESLVRTCMPNFTVVAEKCELTAPKSREW